MYPDKELCAMARTLTTRIEEESLKKIDELAAKRGVDRSALVRSFLLDGLKENTIRDALNAYQGGRMTLWQAAQACDISLWEMIEEAKQRHIHASYDVQALEKDLTALHE
jgi:predicted HTH domain antitoxin